MSKPAKPKAVQGQQAGAYKPESVKDVAEFLNITISDSVASSLASDVEYRLHQVIEEAARFMRHGRRTMMTTVDIDQAFRVLNLEPLYGHTPHNPPTFRRAPAFSHMPAAGPVYFVEDEEIDFDRVLREEKISLLPGVSWTAHWLAVEGVQPLIPENPPAIPRDVDQEGGKSPPRMNGITAPMVPAATKKQQQQQQQQQQLVKQVLSRELQLYYNRLTSSLLPSSSDFTKRTAALASLKNDAGLQALLPYLIKWVGEGVVGALKDGSQSEQDGRMLEVLLDVISSLMENQTLFVEPYLHQILPPILSTLLHSSLPPTHATYLRTSASQTLSRLLTQHSTTYPSLSPRIMKTLLLALISPNKSIGTREGAIRGLMGVGKEAVRKGLVDGGGAKVVGSECSGPGTASLIDSVMAAFEVLHPRSDMADTLDMTQEEDVALRSKLREALGDFFAERISGDAAWSRGILGASNGT
ncbi:TAF-domain-containing protein [Guyanagaster necrorhizus]|uniref:TAF-domain-containing protein n=1 Tax=Guyanagaster necrorhizus TaxID=856835 RepID=A0A9P7VTC0_9AGAR|nr:TAF-domain-containing protein [Guyanagaster necrorhizus MCA 3950]KAG7445571.1 TAF-domain-containing protein [Guyanagaster necrorhizus MCA 3950]